MDWNRAIEEERAALKRIVALLFALADLAELACGRSEAVRGFVLWLLRPAEAVAQSLLAGTATPIPLRQAGDSRADLMRLARNFRDLAREMDRQASAFAVFDDSGQDEPTRFGVRLALRVGGVLHLLNALAILPSPRGALRLAVPDTS